MVASASLELSVLASRFRLDQTFFAILTQQSPSEKLRSKVSSGSLRASFLLFSWPLGLFFFPTFHLPAEFSAWSVFWLELFLLIPQQNCLQDFERFLWFPLESRY